MKLLCRESAIILLISWSSLIIKLWGIMLMEFMTLEMFRASLTTKSCFHKLDVKFSYFTKEILVCILEPNLQFSFRWKVWPSSRLVSLQSVVGRTDFVCLCKTFVITEMVIFPAKSKQITSILQYHLHSISIIYWVCKQIQEYFIEWQSHMANCQVTAKLTSFHDFVKLFVSSQSTFA